jgi:hypothetical protein
MSDLLRRHLRPTDDEHRVTTLELLFDLVFVYAVTNVTGLMEHEIGGTTVLEGLIVLAVVWFGWCSYTWLGNQAQADEGLLRVAMVVAMGGMFFVAISIGPAEPRRLAAAQSRRRRPRRSATSALPVALSDHAAHDELAGGLTRSPSARSVEPAVASGSARPGSRGH